jgi:molybdopterin-guanine dinucleotide biosynthesis protein A
LAGGEGSRLGGVDKGLALLRDRPLIEWVIERLPARARARIVIVANRNLERYSRFAPTLSDAQPGFHGPLAGIVAALTGSEFTWLHTVPVDCPHPPSGILDLLRSAASSCDHSALVAHDGERRQPLFALYHRDLAASAVAALAAGQGVSEWQDSVDAVEVDASRVCGSWLNLNTPEDFTMLAQSWRDHD